MSNELSEIDPTASGEFVAGQLASRWIGVDGKPIEPKALSTLQILNAIRVLNARAVQIKNKLESPKSLQEVAMMVFPFIKNLNEELNKRITAECGNATHAPIIHARGPAESIRRFDFIQEETEKAKKEEARKLNEALAGVLNYNTKTNEKQDTNATSNNEQPF